MSKFLPSVKLQICQVSNATGRHFCVRRVDDRDARSAPMVDLPDPATTVLGDTSLTLGGELAWYLEQYLDSPFGPHERRRDRVLVSLRDWGRQAFARLFGQGQARDFYREARDRSASLDLAIVSDDPQVLAWPWEVLHDPATGELAPNCNIERQIGQLGEPLPLYEELSRERIGILLVAPSPSTYPARRSIVRPLVDLIHEGGVPAQLKLLRPPTFEAMREELAVHPGRYHILHFDGYISAGRQCRLLFEKDDGSADPVSVGQLSQLLREHRIPIVVLGSGQSAVPEAGGENASASVATALLAAGVRSVVGMGYQLYASAAREFFPAFYQGLFATGSVAEGVRAGRLALLAQPERRPGFALSDWLVPMLYQRNPVELKFDARPRIVTQPATRGDIPEEAQMHSGQTPHGLIGRDGALMALETASRMAPAGLLLHGLGGVGKTTLARGYIQWLTRTGGLPERIVWQSFVEPRSFNEVRDGLVEELLGANALSLPNAQKSDALVQALRRNSVLIVWDSFERASGAGNGETQETSAGEMMPAADRQALREFLEHLRGGLTKVLLTSRSDEAWLGMTACSRIPLGGLDGAGSASLAKSIFDDHGLMLDAGDRATADLIHSLQGHPLAMRMVLPQLGSTSPSELQLGLERHASRSHDAGLQERQLNGALLSVADGLPEALRPLLYPIGLHEGHVDADYLAAMATAAGQPAGVREAQQVLALLEKAGLVSGQGNNIFEMHPVLGRFLRNRVDGLVSEAGQAGDWDRAFVGVMAQLADHFGSGPMQRQEPVFRLHGANFEQAQHLAEKRGEFTESAILLQERAGYALNRGNLPLAQALYEALAKLGREHRSEDAEATAYRQLGRIAEARRDFETAEAWYIKSLAISERVGNERAVAYTSHQIGLAKHEMRELGAAQAWYLRSLAAGERSDFQDTAAHTYHQLGRVAQEREDFDAARDWYLKSLEIEERAGNEHNAAVTYHQLGRLAEDRHDFEAAEDWHRKSLHIKEQLGDRAGAARSFHQLGIVAEARQALASAEVWYRESCKILEQLGDELAAASTYHQLGNLAVRQGNFETAEDWYRKSLEIKRLHRDEHGAAATLYQLGFLMQVQRNLDVAETHYRASLEIALRSGNERTAARSYHRLGTLAEERHDLTGAEAFYRSALETAERDGDEAAMAATSRRLEAMGLQSPYPASDAAWKPGGEEPDPRDRTSATPETATDPSAPAAHGTSGGFPMATGDASNKRTPSAPDEDFLRQSDPQSQNRSAPHDLSRDTQVDAVVNFFRQAGCEISINGDSITIEAAPFPLATRAPFPVAFALRSAPDRETIEALATKAARPGRDALACLIYAEPPDVIARTVLAMACAQRKVSILPLDLNSVHRSLAAGAERCAALLDTLWKIYGPGADLFSARNAVADSMLFFGRQDLLNELRTRILRKECVGLFGLRKSGKTSALNHLAASMPGHVVIQLDLQKWPNDNYGGEVFNDMLSQMARQCKRATDSVKFESGTPATQAASRFVDEMLDFGRTIADRGGELPIVLILDELERILPRQGDSKAKAEEFNAFFGAIRALNQRDKILSLLIADLHPDCNRINYWSQSDVATNPIYNFVTEFFVRPFDGGETDEMLNGIGSLMGRRFAPPLSEAIHVKSGGHPVLSRQIASLIVNGQSEQKHLVLDSQAENILENLFDAESFFSTYCEQSLLQDVQKRGSKGSEEIVRILACYDGPGVTLAQLSDKLGDSHSELDVRRATTELRQFGIVGAKRRNGIEQLFILPGLLRQYVRMSLQRTERERWRI